MDFEPSGANVGSVAVSDTPNAVPAERESRMFKALAYAAASKTSPMAPIVTSRREPRSNEVNIEILYCGVCHTDIHTARDARL
jgi:alcohol dehydrogenase (NADP+)